MKTSLNATGLTFPVLLTCLALFLLYAGCNQVPDYIPTLHITTVTSGLAGPMGLETDANGNIWGCRARHCE
jgi:hypothetical protein